MPQKESRREKFMDEMMVDFSDYNRDILAKSLLVLEKRVLIVSIQRCVKESH